MEENSLISIEKLVVKLTIDGLSPFLKFLSVLVQVTTSPQTSGAPIYRLIAEEALHRRRVHATATRRATAAGRKI